MPCKFSFQGIIVPLPNGPLVLVRAVQPVNRYFSAENPEKQPDLECLVGMDSADISELYKVKYSCKFASLTFLILVIQESHPKKPWIF